MTDRVKNILVCIIMAVLVLTISVFAVLKPETKISASERRKMATLPVFSIDEVLSGRYMDEFEDYVKDQFPFRESFRTVKALSATKLFGKKDNNGIYLAEGHASALEYPMDEDSVNNAIIKLDTVYERYIAGKDINVYLSVIPDKNYFLAEKNGYPALDYDEMILQFTNGLSYMEYIDITENLCIDDYYKTDTHWRQESITDVAGLLKEKMGVDTETEYSITKTEVPFYGVYKGQSAMNLNADEICYLSNYTIENFRCYDYQNGKVIPVYDLEKINSDDMYELYLGGPLSLITIENNEADNERELIVFRDSFGSSIGPLLAEGYKKVTLIDIRYMRSDILDRFVDFNDQDVLFLYSTMVINNSETLK